VGFYHRRQTFDEMLKHINWSSQVHGKVQNLTLSQPKTHEAIVTKFKWRDYVGDIYHQKNLGLIRPVVFAPHIGEIYTPPLFACLLFWFLNSPKGESVGPIFTLNRHQQCSVTLLAGYHNKSYACASLCAFYRPTRF